MSNNSDILWRNQELKDTDWICSVIDHPERNQTLAYRQKLRDWPETEYFSYGIRPANEPEYEIPDVEEDGNAATD